MYGEKDKLDEMAKKAYGTNKLYARKNVLKQWFSILKNTNRYYKNFEDTIIDNIISEKLTTLSAWFTRDRCATARFTRELPGKRCRLTKFAKKRR